MRNIFSSQLMVLDGGSLTVEQEVAGPNLHPTLRDDSVKYVRRKKEFATQKSCGIFLVVTFENWDLDQICLKPAEMKVH